MRRLSYYVIKLNFYISDVNVTMGGKEISVTKSCAYLVYLLKTLQDASVFLESSVLTVLLAKTDISKFSFY